MLGVLKCAHPSRGDWVLQVDLKNCPGKIQHLNNFTSSNQLDPLLRLPAVKSGIAIVGGSGNMHVAASALACEEEGGGGARYSSASVGFVVGVGVGRLSCQSRIGAQSENIALFPPRSAAITYRQRPQDACHRSGEYTLYRI